MANQKPGTSLMPAGWFYESNGGCSRWCSLKKEISAKVRFWGGKERTELAVVAKRSRSTGKLLLGLEKLLEK